MDQNEQYTYLFEGAVRYIAKEMLSLFSKRGVFWWLLLGLLLLLLLLKVILGLSLGYFSIFLGRDSLWLFFRSSPFVGGIFNFNEGSIVSNHFFSHFL